MKLFICGIILLIGINLFGCQAWTYEKNQTNINKNDSDIVVRDQKQGNFVNWLLWLVGQGQNLPSLTGTTVGTSEILATTSQPEIAKTCEECECGIANKKKRIVGGKETEVNQYPWMAMLMYNGRFYCGASLINDRYLLTASHCVHNFNKSFISVRLLDHSRSMSSPNKIDRKISDIYKHSKYSSVSYDNDIAILKMDKPVEIKEMLRPVCLPTPGKSFSGKTGIVTGWGATKEGGYTSDTLQEVKVPIMSNNDCRKSRYGSSRITDNMLCAGHKEGKMDSCQGDSGGPLHITEGVRHEIVGIVSWGEGCAKADYPGVYARVNRYGTWIRSMTKDACQCKEPQGTFFKQNKLISTHL